jgi:osmotically inducible protein OsmC
VQLNVAQEMEIQYESSVFHDSYSKRRTQRTYKIGRRGARYAPVHPPQPGRIPHSEQPGAALRRRYGACFENAVLHIAQLKKVRLEKTTIAVKVDLQTFEDGHFNVGVAMDLDIQGVDDQIARQLIEAAHRVCPYSNATRGNIDLTISLRGERIV